jgi:histidinol-phosphate aminotransferase
MSERPPLGPRSVVDLDANENALGTPDSVVRAVSDLAGQLHRYPRDLHEEVRSAVADDAGVASEQVVLTAGVDEAIDLVLTCAGRATCFTPGFPGYPARAAVLGVPLRVLTIDEVGDRWVPPPAAVCVDDGGVVVITDPNVPVGHLQDPAWVDAVLAGAALVCIDETYLEFSGRPSYVERLDQHPNLCVFRSFSKSFGLAGVRAGALFGQAALMTTLEQRSRFFPVDSIALRAVGAAVADHAFRRASVEHVQRWREPYAATLAAWPSLFTEVRPSVTNFVAARCPSPAAAAALIADLGARGVQVADCTPLGLAGWVRVTVGTAHQLDRLSRGLADVASRTPPILAGTRRGT